MWTNPSEEIDRRSARVKVIQSSRQFASLQSGAKLLMKTWTAEGVAPSARLIYVHGALAHIGRDTEMLEWMVRRSEGKLAVHGFDLVGHGLSTGPRAHVDHFGVYLEDFLTIFHHISSESTGGQIFLMGHSLGGLIVLKTLLEAEQKLPQSPAGVILSNPCIRPHKGVEFPRMEDVLETLSRRFPQFRLPRLHRGKDMTLNPVAANQFETDPLIPAFMTARMVREVWYAAEEVRALSYFVKVPALFLVSEQDAVVDRDATLLFTRGIDKKWVTIRHYKNAQHELLHENVRQKVWRDIIDWMSATKGDA